MSVGSPPPLSAGTFVATPDQLVSQHAFRVVLWVGLGLCLTTFVVRSYIRIVCFGRLLAEDYLMVAAFLILVAIVSVSLVFLGDMFWMPELQNGRVMPGLDVFDRMRNALRSVGVIAILNMIGIWTIKLNFMLFFYRLGHQIHAYKIFWWISVFVVMACGVVSLGVIPYRCHFRDVVEITKECGTHDGISHIYNMYIVSVAVDVVSDAMILCFPIVILWRTRIGLRQKLVLSSIFSLVGFTIAVTIVRGSIFGGTYKSIHEVQHKVVDTSWLMFWFFIQYITSFIVSCLVSFRSLWAHRENQTRDKSEKQRLAARQRAEHYQKQESLRKSQESGLRSKWNKLHDSVLDTFRDLEGTSLSTRDDIVLGNRHASSIMIAGDFMPGDHDVNWSTASKTRVDSESQVDILGPRVSV